MLTQFWLFSLDPMLIKVDNMGSELQSQKSVNIDCEKTHWSDLSQILTQDFTHDYYWNPKEKDSKVWSFLHLSFDVVLKFPSISIHKKIW